MNVTSLSSVSKATVADGVWFNDNIIDVAAKNLSAIAMALDDSGLTNISAYLDSAYSGISAYDKIKSYDFADIQTKANNGASAWFSAIGVFDCSGVANSAYSGFKAAEKVLPYDINAIKKNAELGYDTYTRCSAYDMQDMLNSAIYSRAGYNIVTAYQPNISSLIDTHNKTQALTAYGIAAAKWCENNANRITNASNRVIGTEATWDRLLPYSANATRQQYLNAEYEWLDANKDIAVNTHLALSNSANWCSAYNAVIAKSGETRWTNAYTTLQTSGANTSAGVILWDDVAKNADLRNDAVNCVSTNSAKWNAMYNVYTSSKNPSMFYDTLRNYSANWFDNAATQTFQHRFSAWSAQSAVYQRRFYDDNNSLAAISGDMMNVSAIVASGRTYWPTSAAYTNWDNLSDIVENRYGHAKWNSMALSAYRTCAVNCVMSSHSAKWDEMGFAKSGFVSFSSYLTGCKAPLNDYWSHISEFSALMEPNSLFLQAISACSGKSKNWPNVQNNYAAWGKLYNVSNSSQDKLNNCYDKLTATSSRMVRTTTSAALKILMRKGFFTKYHSSAASADGTIYLVS